MIKNKIRDLMIEAGIHGDMEQVRICYAALEGDEAAQAECIRVIRAADRRERV